MGVAIVAFGKQQNKKKIRHINKILFFSCRCSRVMGGKKINRKIMFFSSLDIQGKRFSGCAGFLTGVCIQVLSSSSSA